MQLPSTMERGADAAVRNLSVWLAGCIAFEDFQPLAERLAWEVSEPHGRPPTLIIHELPPAITIGRLGSRVDLDWTPEDLEARGIPVRFIGRGGGAVPHGPGQICISLFAPLAAMGLGPHQVGSFLDRFESGLEVAVRSLRCTAARDSRCHGIFGRSGLLAAVGVAIRRGIVWHGGFLNVGPALDLYRGVRTVPGRCPGGAQAGTVAVRDRCMGSIEADLRRRVRLPEARAAVVDALVDALGFPDASIQSGLPYRISPRRPAPSEPHRVG